MVSLFEFVNKEEFLKHKWMKFCDLIFASTVLSLCVVIDWQVSGCRWHCVALCGGGTDSTRVVPLIQGGAGAPDTRLTHRLWVYNPHLAKIYDVISWNIMITIITSGHNFAHVMTAQLSWHVQSCGLIWSLKSYLKHGWFSQDFNYVLITLLWFGSQISREYSWGWFTGTHHQKQSKLRFPALIVLDGDFPWRLFLGERHDIMIGWLNGTPGTWLCDDVFMTTFMSGRLELRLNKRNWRFKWHELEGILQLH